MAQRYGVRPSELMQGPYDELLFDLRVALDAEEQRERERDWGEGGR